MVYVYKTKGVCSREMTVDVDENGIIQSCVIKGGCPGNLLGISRIVIGMKAEDVIERFRGTRCGFRSTSCPISSPMRWRRLWLLLPSKSFALNGSCPFPGQEFFVYPGKILFRSGKFRLLPI